MTAIRTTTASIEGTSLCGTMTATYAALVAAFGEPDGGSSKTDVEWVLMTPAGIATVYNWKNGPAYGGSEVVDITDWNIGGHTSEVVDHVRGEVGA